jgi:tryptophan-rich sensory protein
MILETIKLFKPIDALASKLLIPYLLWVSFATLLNGSIWWLNR